MNQASQPLSGISGKPEDKKILVAEKDVGLIDLYSGELKKEGFHVRTLESGLEVLPYAIEYHPDLVIMPIHLAHKDGLAVAEELRGNLATKNVKIIIVTSVDGELERNRAKELGVSEYFVKSHTKFTSIAEAVKDQLGIHPPIEEEQQQ
jgi:DNA-binding response OmpR family regulator